MRQIVLISGRTSAGKSGLASVLRLEYGFEIVKTSELITLEAKKRGENTDRMTLQRLGDELDAETDHRWVMNAVTLIDNRCADDSPIVVDNVRNPEQLEHFRRNQNWNIFHVHLYAPTPDRERRYAKKIQNRPHESAQNYTEADLIKNENDVESFKKDADVRINTARTDDKDNLVRVAARLGLLSAPNIRCVDVLIGGQYGSEGKGHVAAYLAREYDILVRVGGPNAGHTVSSESGVYTYHQLPSGARDTDAILLLGPGMTINVEKLLIEIEECEINESRLYIDPQAMIIEPLDVEREKVLVKKIASTGRGGGSAAARRIIERHEKTTRLARDIPELEPFVGKPPNYRGATARLLEKAYRQGCSILLEGTQGSLLSIFHGPYPHVTSRDTNVAGCLAEAGISPNRVRRILMVIRPTPIRVGDPDGNDGYTSGHLKHEVDFETIADLAGLNPDELLGNEKTSTTNRDRRVGWFEWEQFRNACALNAPTDIVLTFADYIKATNQNARRFEQLDVDTIKFIEEIERVAQAPVSLINTRFPRDTEDRFDLRTIIDRRNWTTQQKTPSWRP